MQRALIALSFVVAASATPALSAAPDVVTDIAPVHSLVAQVMGDLGTPALLLDQGGDPHSFQLRPSQARALAGADLLFWVGPELTPWLERALDGTGMKGVAVDLLHADGTRLHAFGDDGHDPGHHAHPDDAGHDHDHPADGLDPHAWLDPANAAVWLGVIAARLTEADPDNAATYAANAEIARARIAALDAALGERLAPAAGRPLFVFHDAYGYFASAYGLTMGGSVAGGDAAAPGAAAMQALRSRIVAAGAPCLFAEAGHDPAPLEVLAEAAGTTFGVLDPTGVTLTPGPDLYAEMMTALAESIAGCGG